MYSTTALKDIIERLNDKDISKEYRCFLAWSLIKILVGNLVPGVMYELEDRVCDLSLTCHNMRFASFDGSLYLMDQEDIEKLYSGNIEEIHYYLKNTDGVLEVVNNDVRLTYNINRKNHLSYYGVKGDSIIENELFYNDNGQEYYRVNKIKSAENSLVNYYIQNTLHRINDETLEVNGYVYLNGMMGMETVEQEQEPYIINYSGDSLSINLDDYSHYPIGTSLK